MDTQQQTQTQTLGQIVRAYRSSCGISMQSLSDLALGPHSRVRGGWIAAIEVDGHLPHPKRLENLVTVLHSAARGALPGMETVLAECQTNLDAAVVAAIDGEVVRRSAQAAECVRRRYAKFILQPPLDNPPATG